MNLPCLNLKLPIKWPDIIHDNISIFVSLSPDISEGFSIDCLLKKFNIEKLLSKYIKKWVIPSLDSLFLIVDIYIKH